jgi:outer membrane murein-binding lipoprotein Lpp
MPVMLERWNDDKMDELAGKVDVLGTDVAVLDAKVDGLAVQMREQRQEMREQRLEMREQRLETKAGLEKLDDRFQRMQWNLLGAAVTIIVALITAPHL